MSTPQSDKRFLPSLETMENRLVPSASDFVTGLYQDVLHRAPSSGEVNSWVGSIQNGLSSSNVVHAFVQSDERHGIEINDIYQKVLHRAGDDNGVKGWVQAMRQGQSRDAVERAFIGSAEFQAMHPDDKTFVEGLYQTVLNRLPGTAETQAWKTSLGSGLSRDLVIRFFQNSEERLNRQVDDLYTNYLKRSEGTAERDGWVRAVQNGAFTVEQEFEFFLGSQEYKHGHGFDDPAGHA